MRRWPNPDPRTRGVERAIRAGDRTLLPALLTARLQAGDLTERDLLFAEYFSRPLAVLHGRRRGQAASGYVWAPLGEPEYARFAHRAAQDPRTLELHGAIAAVLGRKRLRGRWLSNSENEPDRSIRAMDKRGYAIWRTDSYDHPPFEVQYIQDPESDEQAAAIERLIDAFVATLPGGGLRGPSGEPLARSQHRYSYYGDAAAQWDLRNAALAHEKWAVEALAWLRRWSTVEYMNVLGGYWLLAEGWPGNPAQGHVPWLVRELTLVRSFLGGPPV